MAVQNVILVCELCMEKKNYFLEKKISNTILKCCTAILHFLEIGFMNIMQKDRPLYLQN